MTTRARSPWWILLLASLPLALGCPDDATSTDAGPDATADAGEADPDAGEVPVDAGEAPDGGEDPTDAGADAGTPDGGEVMDDLRVEGLTAPVEVRFDEYGVLHVRCQTDADCFAVEGYYHAAHRFGQMDFRRRAGTGRLAALYGNPAGQLVPVDLQLRTLLSTRDGGSLAQQIWDSSTAETRAMVEAYTRGVNAWLADLRAGRNGAQQTQENALFTPEELVDWAPLDSVACTLVLMAQLTDQSDDEIRAGRLFAALPPTQALDLAGFTPASPATVLPRASFVGETPDAPALAAAMAPVQSRLQQVQSLLQGVRRLPNLGLRGDSYGSNNWVVSASQASGSSALLANDPHLGFSNPAVWYLVSLDSKTEGSGTVHVAGSSFAGLPGILIGQNEDLAWGLTTTFFDMSDVYVETLNETQTGVLFDDGEVPFTSVDYTFEVAGGSAVTRTALYVPHHGPVLNLDAEAGTALTLRWTGQDADTDLNFILRLMQATSVEDARDNALTQVTTIGQNFVIADDQGTIAWLPYNRLPGRPWASTQLPPWLPLPGDGTAEWTGTVAYADLPQTVNPAQGYVATANNDMTGAVADGDPTDDGNPWFQTFLALGYRQERILERLADGAPNHSVATMQAIQADTHSLLAERTVPPLLTAIGLRGRPPLSMAGQAVADAISGWDYTCPTGVDGRDPAGPKVAETAEAEASIACAAFHVLWTEVVRGAFDDELRVAGADEIMAHGPTRAAVRLVTGDNPLAGGDSYWDDQETKGVETARDTVEAAFERAGMWLSVNLGADPDDWRWGRIHTVTLAADLWPLFGTTRYDNGPWANDGGWYTVDVANPGGGAFDGDFSHGSGPSMRLACEAASTGPTCTIELPGGQRNRPGEDHYEDLFLRWLENQPVPLRFTPADIDAAAQETLTVRPPQ